VYGSGNSVNKGYRDITIKFKNGKTITKSNLFYVEDKSTGTNTPPKHQRTYTNGTPTQNQPFYIYSTWSDAEKDYIVAVKLRYRKQGSTSWREVSLDHDKETTFKKEITLSQSGKYEIQVKASDVKVLGTSFLHTTNWLNANTIQVNAKSSKMEITKFDKENILATSEYQYLTIYGTNFSKSSTVQWKYGNNSNYISTDRTWASESQVRIKLRTLSRSTGTWQFRVKNGYQYSNWKSIQAISTGGTGNHLTSYKNAIGGSCDAKAVLLSDPWNFYRCECTSYVAWKMNKRGIYFKNRMNSGHFGNAQNWAKNARAIGWTVSTTPTVGSIAQNDNGTWGHVAYVEAVNGNNIRISEYNLNLKHNYNTRTVSKSKFDYYLSPKTVASDKKPEIYNFDKTEVMAKDNRVLIINGKNFTKTSTVDWKWSYKSGTLQNRPQFISTTQLKITFNTQGGAGEWNFRVKNGNLASGWKGINATVPKSVTKPQTYKFSHSQSSSKFNLSFYAFDKDGDLDRVEIYWDGNSDKEVISNNLSAEIKRSHTYKLSSSKTTKTITVYAYDKAGNRSIKRTLPVNLGSQYTNTKVNDEKVAINSSCQPKKGRSIGTATGAEMMTLSLLKVKGLHTVSFDLSYNSLLLTDNTISKGWNHNFGFTSYIETLKNGDMKVYWDDGHYNVFIRKYGTSKFYSTQRATQFDVLEEKSDKSFVLTRKNRIQYIYSKDGKIKDIQNYKNQMLNFAFDEQGYIQRVTDATSGVYLDYTYDNNGKLLKVSDELAREVLLSYNEKNQLIKIITPENISYNFEYTSDLGQLYKATYGDGTPYYKHSYNSKGQVISEDDGKGNNQLAKFNYNDNGSILTTYYTNKEGKATVYKYDSKDFKLLSITDAFGNQTTNQYSSDGKLISTVNAKGYRTQFGYDNQGNRVSTRFEDGSSETMNYDNNRNLLRHTLFSKNGTDFTTTNRYDSKNNLIQKTLPNRDSIRYSYNSNNQIASITSPKGYTIRYSYEKGRLKKVTNAKNQSVTYEYDIVGRMVKKTDPLGNSLRYTYDNADRLIKITDPQGGVSTFTYDSRGNKIAESDPMGNISTYEYDNNNNLISSTNTLGATTTYSYDGEDRLIKTTNASGKSSQIIYDSLGRVTKTIDAMGNSHRVEYDALGNVKKEYDSYGNMLNSYSYDSKNRLVKAVDILNNQTATSYNVLNQPATITDPLNRVSKFNYDKVGRVTLAIDAMGGRTTQSFDQEGNRVSFTDPNSNKTSFEYDKLGNIIKEETASGSSSSYSYNANGQVIKTSNGRGQSKTISYNSLGAVTKISDRDGTINYGYDKNGNVLTITENGKTIRYTYDVLNRLTSYTDTMGNKISYGYDVLGNLTTLSYPDGKMVRYGYNSNGQLVSVVDWNGNQTSYEYDKNGRLTKTRLPNGSYIKRTYDSAGRLLQQYTYPDLSNYSFKYDKVGNIIEEESSSEISPQELANIQMQYTKGNLLKHSNFSNAKFDKDDNMLKLDSLSLSYDSRNRLTRANNTSYVYNALNHRVSKTTNGKTTKYITNPNAPLSQLLVKTDSDGSKTYYVYGLGLISQTKNSKTLYYHYDLRGSTIMLSDKNRRITDRFSYLPYGELFKHSLGSTDTPFLYNGRDGVMREENSLYYMRARYYSTDIKRFVNRDILIGGVGDFGSLNRFGYVNGNSINFIDPSGNVLDTIWDVGNMIHDIGRIGKNGLEMIYEGGRYTYGSAEGYFTGDYSRQHDASKEFVNDASELGSAGIDLILDTGAAVIPFAPAGGRKIYKQVKNMEERYDLGKNVNPRYIIKRTRPDGKQSVIYGNKLRDGKNFNTDKNPIAKPHGHSVRTKEEGIEYSRTQGGNILKDNLKNQCGTKGKK
jgi:RHS repeat-associated protein